MTDRAQPWTTEELGEAVGVTGAYIRRLCAKGEIVAYKVGKTWVVPNEEARRYIDDRQRKTE